ncbi:Prophage tail length tape measure protein [Agrobacterium deltaense Zutra 3/1]|uniref:Prophage tail length tape measure protein n=1 Tax=Agrobacterium deltaense Zutra 3/1 TaxID=1183427 RepID=A0A1S7QSZ5_9HYPH|nr:phage tail length tape measure family protein [Agrobacterium deltaense]CUX41728.1 Prophage tail length tape measure protein [Agrobacterium deltaense Zutra 3/1]
MQYKQAQVEIRSAHAAGALSADEMTAALDRSRRSTLASIDAIKGRNKAIADTPVAANVNTGVRGFETANIAAQLQDIGVTTAMGMSPLQIALQQGTQLSAIIGGMQNPIRGLAAAFMSVVSPVSLVTIGVIAAGTAAIQYFSTFGSEGEKSKKLLEEQAELVGNVVRQWGEAVPALKAYSDALQSAKDAQELLKATDQTAGQQWEIARKQVVDLNIEFADLMTMLQSAGLEAESLKGLQRSWDGVTDSIRKGKTDTEAINSVQQSLASALQSTGIPAVGNFSKAFGDLSNTIAGAARQANIFREQALQALLTGQNGPNLNQLSPLFTENGKFVSGKDFTPINPPVPEKRPLRELSYLPGEEKELKAAARSATSAANAYRDLIKTADDRVAQMKLEAELAGQTGVAAEALRFKLDLLQQSEEKGRSLSSKQVEAINSRVEAFKKYAEAAASAKLKADLLFEREQLGRSSMDQQIAGALRSSGLPVDFDSYEAGLIRTNYQLQYARDLAGEFTSTFFDGLRQGESVWDAFGNAGVKALQRIADTLMNDVLNSMFSVSSASSGSGGGLFSGLLGGLGSLFGGGTGAFPSAPGGLYAKGGTFLDGISGYSNHVVNKPTLFAFAKGTGLMGEAGPEAIMPLTRDASGRLGVSADVSPLMSPKQAAASSATAQRIELAIKLGLSVDESGNIIPIVKQIVAEDAPEIAMTVVESYDRDLPNRIAQIDADPRLR